MTNSFSHLEAKFSTDTMDVKIDTLADEVWPAMPASDAANFKNVVDWAIAKTNKTDMTVTVTLVGCVDDGGFDKYRDHFEEHQQAEIVSWSRDKIVFQHLKSSNVLIIKLLSAGNGFVFSGLNVSASPVKVKRSSAGVPKPSTAPQMTPPQRRKRPLPNLRC